jgi:1-acyl-sn-glycerol-3-phosphate acyltransferase
VNDFDLRPARDLGLAPWERLKSVRRESGPILTACHCLWGMVTWTYFKTWHRLQVYDRERLPAEPPFVLCANHASHLDALALAVPLPLSVRDRVFSLAAGDVFFESAVPTAFAAGFINALPMWRKKRVARALQELRERLVGDPCGFILFPEGARSRTGDYLPFKSGIGMLVAGTDVPVVPCHLRGTFEALPAGRKLPRPRRIEIRIGEPVRFPEVPNEKEGWTQVSAVVEERIRALGCQTAAF